MSKEKQIAILADIIEESYANVDYEPTSIAQHLVDNGIGDKDRFRIGEEQNLDDPAYFNQFIKPKEYKEEVYVDMSKKGTHKGIHFNEKGELKKGVKMNSRPATQKESEKWAQEQKIIDHIFLIVKELARDGVYKGQKQVYNYSKRIAGVLISNGIGDKDRFEVASNHHKTDRDGEWFCNPLIKPKNYKEV